MKSANWHTITESQFPWEREALEFVRSRFPDREPYRAWSNFEFIADDGSINEVDLLILTPLGFFLVEIKSRPGIIRGDPGTWTWQHDGRVFTDDNPILAADRKAKKLKSLLERQKAIKEQRKEQRCQKEKRCQEPLCARFGLPRGRNSGEFQTGWRLHRELVSRRWSLAPARSAFSRANSRRFPSGNRATRFARILDACALHRGHRCLSMNLTEAHR